MLAVAAAEVEAAFLGRHQYIFIWRQFGGEGTIYILGQAVGHRPRSPPLRMQDSGQLTDLQCKKSPFLNRIVKRKEGVLRLKL